MKLSILFLGASLFAAGCWNRLDDEPVLEFQTSPPAGLHGVWRTSWGIRTQFGHKELDCRSVGAVDILARVTDDDDRQPKKEHRFRAACDISPQVGFAELEPGRYRVKVELRAANGKVLSTTQEGTLVMPADGHPQGTPVLFELPDGVVMKGANQKSKY